VTQGWPSRLRLAPHRRSRVDLRASRAAQLAWTRRIQTLDPKLVVLVLTRGEVVIPLGGVLTTILWMPSPGEFQPMGLPSEQPGRRQVPFCPEKKEITAHSCRMHSRRSGKAQARLRRANCGPTQPDDELVRSVRPGHALAGLRETVSFERAADAHSFEWLDSAGRPES
jgi:hypothetical protein